MLYELQGLYGLYRLYRPLTPPKPMHIAIGARFDMLGFQAEFRHGFLSRFQMFSIDSMFRDYFNPFNVMLGFHRMRNASHIYDYSAIDFFHHGPVFFIFFLFRFFNLQFHQLPATNQLPNSDMRHLNNIPAHIALINLI